MQGLDPLMGGILEKMNEVTDHSNLLRLQQDKAMGLPVEGLPSVDQGLAEKKDHHELDPYNVAAESFYNTSSLAVGAGPIAGSK